MQKTKHISLIESILYGEDDIYHWDASRRLTFQLEGIRDAFEFHYERCPIFRRFCAVENIAPISITSPEDILKIPLIPSSVFKTFEIQSVPDKDIVKVCCSSGTRGSISRVLRDNLSLERFLGSIRISTDKLLEMRPDAQVFNLGPDTNEAGDVWFSYVMSLLGLLRRSENYVRHGVLYMRSLLEDLGTLQKRIQPILVGPPIFFVYFMSFLEEEGVTLDLSSQDGFVITAGGWKSFSSQELDREEFVLRCAKHFGIKDNHHIRDAYNMVELNTVIFECELGVKHIPPWLVVSSFNPETLSPMRAKEMGLLGFYDPLPTSYPGFILSDDFGRVNNEACDCGRSGPTMEFCRRVNLIEDRGCALTMDRNTQTTREEHIPALAYDRY